MKKRRNRGIITSSFKERNVLMIILEHYLRLHIALAKEKKEKVYEVSLSEISKVLYCTARNSKMTINKWEKEGWVEWLPGRGRGNKSRLIFLREPIELIFEESKKHVINGKLETAQQLVDKFNVHYPSLSSIFMRWIDTMFGYKIENREQKQRDVLRMKYDKQPFSPLDPTLATLRSECHILKHVCDTLVDFNEETLVFEPRLAFHWEVNEAGDQWTFYIRKGVKFHNGSSLTAYDIQHSILRFQEIEDSPFQWMLVGLKEAKVIDPHCITLILDKPNFLLLDILSDEHLSIVSRSSAINSYAEQLIGTGPFKLKKNDGSMLVLEANENYFRERPFLDSVEIWNVPEENGDRTPVKNEIKFGYSRYSTDNQVGRSRPQTLIRLEKNVQFLSLNRKKNGPMRDPFLQQAIRMIANSSLLVEELGEFRQENATSFLQPKLCFVREDPKVLLEQSVYNGEELHLYSFQDRDHVEDAHWLKDKFENYGINVTNHFVPAEILLKRETMEKADIVHDSATLTEQEEVSFLQFLLTENSPVYHHLNQKLKRMVFQKVSELKGKTDRKERMGMLQSIEKMLLDACQVVPLYKNLSELHSDEKIQHALINSQGWVDFYRIWFKETTTSVS
ncbi:ABC transporter substrate-binding protein [Bacillus spongiae]|uniref:ABC transporter substrate-binding protein n=1 Tax=Bacillus spongiae TaxID=2683610 RepID=A0ABU8HEA7_9BACI